MSRSTYGIEPRPKLGYYTFACILALFIYIYLSNVEGASFMCLTSISIYIDPWKSFVKFGIKKSHEMISYILIGLTLLSA